MLNTLNDEKEIMRAHADLIGSDAGGTAQFLEVEKGTQRIVKVELSVKADPKVLPEGMHGVHIHEKGICELPDFKSAGGHFDPGPAGNTDPDVNHPYHLGDLPNILIDSNGTGRLEAISTRFTLSDGPLCIFDEDGASIMVHAHKDPGHGGDHGSGISGGPRVACGVIEKV